MTISRSSAFNRFDKQNLSGLHAAAMGRQALIRCSKTAFCSAVVTAMGNLYFDRIKVMTRHREPPMGCLSGFTQEQEKLASLSCA